MATLNNTAAEVMEPYTVHACTDVTGFGLLGHALEMAKGSNTGIHIYKQECLESFKSIKRRIHTPNANQIEADLR
ncbi:hypothetical protein GCM10011351_31430 [Paraliobacillus quinghaiensis]|uniref:PurM-like C-terminal domain-containing protein n=1 Tax=Paraliobacillus quinghaiensis TaxID=470815 RepID=A0A917WZ03_9BACI|nr:hypothetical protein GCM10011351_31430 [Paraliobacillus quinghaiensis]